MITPPVLRTVIALFLLATFSGVSWAQDCAPPPISANSKNYNIFSPEQEMVVGELTYQRAASEWRFLRNEELSAYLDRIGERLIKHLPPTGLKYRFFIVDLPEVNAFNIPGGYVFVSRKLISFSNNEDELAGVIAHELGHAVVRHGANDLSEIFKKVLNVTQVGDAKDVTEKYNLLIERQRTRSSSRREGHENAQQLEADRIGLFAMVAAGYDGNAFTSLFGRLTESTGKGSGWFSSIFGKTSPSEKRMREMVKVAEQMPAPCKENRGAAATQDFLNWQANVVSARDLNRKEELRSLLWKKDLSPRLRSDISHFDFTQDGKYFLVQDDFSVHVVQRDPLKILFHIPAAKAREAFFTPDNQHIVFGTENLRMEKWSIAEQKPVSIRELVVRRDCWESEYSPDGNYLACVTYDLSLNVLETQTGKKVFERKNFYELSFFEVISWLGASVRGDAQRQKFFNLEFSPDSRTLVVTRAISFRFQLFINGLSTERSQDAVLALDLQTLKPIGVSGELKKLTRTPFLFLDSNRVLAMSDQKVADGGIFSFPEGKRLAKFPLQGMELRRTSNPDYVIVKPLASSRMGFVDVKRGALAAGMDKVDATIWNDVMIHESVSGTVLISRFAYDENVKTFKLVSRETLEIPVGTIGDLLAAEVSGNFEWVAISSKSRGALWNLKTGERKMHVRGFRGLVLADNGSAVAQFPKLFPETHNLAVLNPAENSAQVILELPDRGAQQYRQFLLTRKSLKAEKEGGEPPSLTREVKLELRNIIDNKVIWSREFPKEAPRYFFDEFSGRLIFYWTLGSEAGKARLKEDPALAARAKELGNKDDDYLMDVFDAFAGKSVGTLLLETGKGSFEIESGFSEGEWLILHDSENRVLCYSLKSGELQHRFFGAQAAVNPFRNQIIVENYPGELTLYDLSNGESQGRLVFTSNAAFVRFSVDGKRLFVLTAEQQAYAFDAQTLGGRGVAVSQ